MAVVYDPKKLSTYNLGALGGAIGAAAAAQAKASQNKGTSLADAAIYKSVPVAQQSTGSSGGGQASGGGSGQAAQPAAGGAAGAAQAYLAAIKGNNPSPYRSTYADQMEALLAQIQGRGTFQYDAKSDPLYNIYRDLYISNGRRAMQDTMGQAAALTGGYGNSYAQAAGQQQYNQYMEGLNAMVPQLQQQAYEQYKGEGDMLTQQYGVLSDAEEGEYKRFRDMYADWQEQQKAQQQAAQYAAALAAQKDQGQQDGQDQAGPGKVPTETAQQIQQNATAFINYLPTEKEFNERKKTSSAYQQYGTYGNYVLDKLDTFLRDGRLTDAEAKAAALYYKSLM